MSTNNRFKVGDEVVVYHGGRAMGPTNIAAGSDYKGMHRSCAPSLKGAPDG